MAVTEQINKKIEGLPLSIQQEVLDFVEFLSEKSSRRDETVENERWQEFSLSQAMKGMEDEELPEYTDADLKEKWD